MDAKDLELLQASFRRWDDERSTSGRLPPKPVVLHCADGEVIVADVLLVSEEDQDIIFDVVSTNRPDASRIGAACLLPFSEVSSVEPWQNQDK
jgi:hypothetical protein